MKNDEYDVYNVELAENLRVEPMGTKPKFWFIESGTDRQWLFKYARRNTGEDWAEKVASEIASLLDLPHAKVELAACQQRRGTITLDFTDRGRKGDLVHGNELLVEIDNAYPQGQHYHASQHRIDNIVRVISQGFIAPSTVAFFPNQKCDPVGLFLGYLLLDALIGNTDRHHENWGLLVKSEGGQTVAELAPTFDHASSLGRELNDQRVKLLLSESRDRNAPTVAKYSNRARSAIYLHNNDKKALSPLDAFTAFRPYASSAADIWLDRLSQTNEDDIQETVKKVPVSILSPERKEFVCRLLRYNRRRLLETEAFS